MIAHYLNGIDWAKFSNIVLESVLTGIFTALTVLLAYWLGKKQADREWRRKKAEKRSDALRAFIVYTDKVVKRVYDKRWNIADMEKEGGLFFDAWDHVKINFPQEILPKIQENVNKLEKFFKEGNAEWEKWKPYLKEIIAETEKLMAGKKKIQ